MYKILLIAFGASLAFTWLARRVAIECNVFDIPSGRKIHSAPAPLLGGLAVFAAYALALGLNFRFSIELKGIFIASAIIMLAGLVDDVKDLPALARLIIQVICAGIVIYCGVRIRIIPNTVPYAFAMESVITVLWIVGITNAINFMDGADGLATGIAVIAAGTFFTVAYLTGQDYFAFLNLALAGACLGFLFFNFHPAKIFLGDAGSSFLGFSLAALSVMGEWGDKNAVISLSIPLLVLAIPIFDIIYISISRIARGKVHTFREWIEYVGKDHLHHRLMAIGFTHVPMVLFIWLISLALAIDALVLKNATTYQALLLLLQGMIFLVIIMILMIAGRHSVENGNGRNE